MSGIFFAAVLFLSACSDNTPSIYDCVVKNWHYVSATDEQGNIFKKVSANDIMSLTSDNGKNIFKYDIEAENIHASGTWELKDNTLVFTYETGSKSPVRYFRIAECAGNRLVFEENGITFVFSD